MPKCPRCQKEVYFGKSCLPPPPSPILRLQLATPVLPVLGAADS